MEPSVAYLAGGKLYVKSGSGAAEAVESPFAQELVNQAARTRERNEWKSRSATGQLMAGGAAWAAAAAAASRPVRISGVTRGTLPGELLYALAADRVGGLFLYDTAEGTERRLFHRASFHARHLARHPDGGQVAFSVYAEDGSADLAVVGMDGGEPRMLTEGDSMDEAPSWTPDGSRLLYQSAGIGRDGAGLPAGTGPYAIQELDLAAETVRALVEDPARDYLLPRMGADGALYAIRRPYRARRAPSALAVMADVVLLPVRLLWAFIGFLSLFSVLFSGKPLMTAGGPPKEGPEERHLLLLGRMVDARRAQREARRGEPPGLVPANWELVRRPADGGEQVLAGGVVSYDLCADGGVLFTTGSAVYHLGADGRRRKLCEGRMIEHVLAAE